MLSVGVRRRRETCNKVSRSHSTDYWRADVGWLCRVVCSALIYLPGRRGGNYVSAWPSATVATPTFSTTITTRIMPNYNENKYIDRSICPGFDTYRARYNIVVHLQYGKKKKINLNNFIICLWCYNVMRVFV